MYPLLWVFTFECLNVPFHGPCCYHTWVDVGDFLQEQTWRTICLLAACYLSLGQQTQPQPVCSSRPTGVLAAWHTWWASCMADARIHPWRPSWLASSLVRTHFKCFLLVFLLVFVFPTLTTLDSTQPGEEEANSKVKGGTSNQDSALLCEGRGRAVTHRRLRTSALCKTENIRIPAGNILL